ncbi:MAG: DUF3990 domain-containing protein [Oscillospiraceae bacterium]|jgi:hypothetical protein|nr:DUF3990 domain-containing protein [Oscillospiraceae bacterium]
MILYHGSYTAVEKPDVSLSREKTDFGKGFYLTPLEDQAIRWAERFKEEHGMGVVSSYSFLEKVGEKLSVDVRVLEFNTHTQKWLQFITDCRLGKTVPEYDLIIGGVANDKVIQTVQLYFQEVISARDAIRRLRYNKPNFQYCFKTQAVIDQYIKFMEAREI